MHATRSNAIHDGRLRSREEQTRAWAPPLPDVCILPRTPYQGGESAMVSDGLSANWLPRQRLEWDTRDTLNNRLWADTMESSARQVTSADLTAHPTNGAYEQQPAAARKDYRPYTDAQTVSYFPDSKVATERPVLPPKNLFHNPWSVGHDIEGGGVVRELAGAVKETNRFLTEDTSQRIVGRTFEHQWIPSSATKAIAERKIDASLLLRPAQDDFRKNYLTTKQG